MLMDLDTDRTAETRRAGVNVFICYRQDDSDGFAGRIYDRLASRLGREHVFFDVDDIEPGSDWVEVLSQRVSRCDAMIVVIGRNWLSTADKDGRRRLDNFSDFVRIEIEAALGRNIERTCSFGAGGKGLR